MNYRKFKYLGLLLIVFAAVILLVGGSGLAGAAPSSAVDETKVPHYFGPYPNWANSPFTLADAIVTIADPPDGGRTATATATVGGNGAITAINIIDPGAGYTSTPGVTINNAAGTNASAVLTADAPSTTGSVTSIAVDAPGGGYTLPVVTITDSTVPAGSGATATAYGSVDAVTLQIDQATFAGYSMPTVEFELPDDPNGVQATGYVICAGDPVDGPYCNATPPATVTPESVVVVNSGSGYAIAPNVYILDGTRPDPIRPGGMGVTASSTLEINDVKMDTFGSGYTQGTTEVSIAEYNLADAGAGATASATVEIGAIIGIAVTNSGSGYVTPGGMRKFIDPLPGMCDPATPEAALTG